MRFSPFTGGALAAATIALVALGACATTTATTGTTPTTDVTAPGGAAHNTGAAIAGTTDTTPTPPSGAGHSVTGTGTGSASLGTGIAPGSAQAPTAAAEGNTLASLGGDAHIVSMVDIINTGEIAEGMLARERGTLPQIRAYANQMVQEHTRMQTDDRTLAKNPVFIAGDSAQVARKMAQDSRAELAKLQQAPAGAAFDAMYITDQISDHEQALNALEAAATQARDGAVVNLVKAAIPRVQAHLDEAKRISATLTAH